MKFFTVYKKSKTMPEECILVKTGFCWENFLFGLLWALYKRIWNLVLVYLLLGGTVMMLTRLYPIFNVQIRVIAVAIQIIISFYATMFLEWRLIENGYKKVDFVAESTEEGALLRFLRNKGMN